MSVPPQKKIMFYFEYFNKYIKQLDRENITENCVKPKIDPPLVT